ncbi:MAG: YjbF family lipoprotein, partial [Janthinobacterium lividum]
MLNRVAFEHRQREIAKSLACLLCLVTPLLTACTSPPVQAIVDKYNFYRQGSDAALASQRLDPAYKYLRLNVNGRGLLLVRGRIDAASNGGVENWYSGGYEIVKLQNGRLVGAVGTPVEWRDVSLSSQPDWTQITGATTFTRRRDVMPGYRFGLVDQLSVRPISEPSSTDFVGPLPAGLHLFVETSTGHSPLPPARYA